MTPKLERLQIIWDTDEGWYVRMREQSTYDRPGVELDEPISLPIREDLLGCLSRRQESALRGAARRVARANGYPVPSSLTVEIR